MLHQNLPLLMMDLHCTNNQRSTNTLCSTSTPVSFQSLIARCIGLLITCVYLRGEYSALSTNSMYVGDMLKQHNQFKPAPDPSKIVFLPWCSNLSRLTPQAKYHRRMWQSVFFPQIHSRRFIMQKQYSTIALVNNKLLRRIPDGVVLQPLKTNDKLDGSRRPQNQTPWMCHNDPKGLWIGTDTSG